MGLRETGLLCGILMAGVGLTNCRYSGKDQRAAGKKKGVQTAAESVENQKSAKALREVVLIDPRKAWQRVKNPVRVQDQVRIVAHGKWTYQPQVPLHGPHGQGDANIPEELPMPSSPPGALIVRIRGSDVVRKVGVTTRFLAESAGPIEFRINEANKWLTDNVGSLRVSIEVSGSPLE